MPVDFLSDEQVGSYGRFVGVVSELDLARFFFLDDDDLMIVGRRRGAANRLGFAVQLGTVRYLGSFLDDPTAVPGNVVEFVSRQLGIAAPGVFAEYSVRPKTGYEHGWEIVEAYGYRRTSDPVVLGELTCFLAARTNTRTERPTAVFDQALAWLRREKVLLPGVSLVTRLVAEARAEANEKLFSLLSDRVPSGLASRLDALVDSAVEGRVSGLEELRRAPVRASGPEMVKALERVGEVTAVGASTVDLAGIAPGRLDVLATHGRSTDASTLRRMPERRRRATVFATVASLQVSSVDDVLDLFAVLMATKLIGPATRAAVKDQMRSLPALRRASVTLAAAAKLLLKVAEKDEQGEKGKQIDAAAVWELLRTEGMRERLMKAVQVVEEFSPFGGDDPTLEQVELVKRYATVRPFWSMFASTLPLRSTEAGASLLQAVRGLGALVGRKRVERSEIVDDVVGGAWRRLVFSDPAADGPVDHRAYTLCVLEGTHRALRRRDLFAKGSTRWGDPRVQLLDGDAWSTAKPDVLTALQLADPFDTHMTHLAGRLDDAYTSIATRLSKVPENEDSPLTVETGPDGRTRVFLAKLKPIPEPESLTKLRDLVERMMPRVDLPEVLLEVHAWTGYLNDFTHINLTESRSGSRLNDLALSMAAVLVAEGCNLGFAPVVKHGHPSLNRRRLSHVAQNYLRAETLSAANKRLIDTQASIGTVQVWGGGLVASVDGLRFVVPVRTLDAGPNPRYFGQGQGVTWLNAINDQVAGIGAVVVTGTMRDSLHVLDVILNRDGGPAPEMIATDTASYSDIVFGLFRLLGYQFSPRVADMPDQRLWRLTPPGAPVADYGILGPVARNKLSFKRMEPYWEDMLRVVGSLHNGTVAGYDLLRMLGRDGDPTPLGAAFAEYGRIAKTLHLLAMYDPEDETYRRSIHVQLTTQESRHRLARKIFYGQRGELRQRYRDGQEDQLGVLGLVLNTVILWNTRYIDAALNSLRDQGYPVDDADIARLSPLGDTHINIHGRYAFTSVQDDGLRPLRDPNSASDE
ncbi:MULTISPECIES: Tn3 family transposase [unclassified Cryobacterium]|uniref:Tn3 family transposase n=1 Tax=unclassified Cryobacterium TaxID=2649013 RepID=UPI0018CB7618|nr:Tn3 family transposase [Cryobacterium sp. CAN_C3]